MALSVLASHIAIARAQDAAFPAANNSVTLHYGNVDVDIDMDNQAQIQGQGHGLLRGPGPIIHTTEEIKPADELGGKKNEEEAQLIPVPPLKLNETEIQRMEVVDAPCWPPMQRRGPPIIHTTEEIGPADELGGKKKEAEEEAQLIPVPPLKLNETEIQQMEVVDAPCWPPMQRRARGLDVEVEVGRRQINPALESTDPDSDDEDEDKDEDKTESEKVCTCTCAISAAGSTTTTTSGTAASPSSTASDATMTPYATESTQSTTASESTTTTSSTPSISTSSIVTGLRYPDPDAATSNAGTVRFVLFDAGKKADREAKAMAFAMVVCLVLVLFKMGELDLDLW
jgi:hypothetical protein